MSDKKECVLSVEELDISIDVAGEDERIRELKKLVEGENQQTKTFALDQAEIPPPKIQKVPFILKGGMKSDKYYEPRVVSIGPIHHGKENLCVAERHKPKLAARFIKQSGKETCALYKIIDDRIHQLKDYYHKDVHRFDDKALSWILFLDGCSVLQFIFGLIHGHLNEFMIKSDHIAFVQHDLFLLENQIPYEVLRLLMESSRLRTELKKSIERFIWENVMAPKENKEKKEKKEKLNFKIDNLDPAPVHLLDLLQRALVKNKENKVNCHKKDLSLQSFRNIQELKTAGIDLKLSDSCSLSDITYDSSPFIGGLRLPPMIVDDSTAPKFLNLIAYEGCPDNFRTKYEVTSYVCFLDSLIDHANDVKELRRVKILHNLLGSDEEVASLFNEIATDLVPNNEIYKDVKIKIQKRYNSKWRTWMAQAYHDHFSSPWTILAFIAALVALALSGIQTWFGVFSDPCNSCCACRKS